MAVNIGNQAAQYTIGSTNTFFLASGNQILSAGNGVFNTGFANVELILAGSIISNGQGVNFYNSANNMSINVTSTGVVAAGDIGVTFNSATSGANNSVLQNAGSISGFDRFGVGIYTVANSLVNNTGTIFGEDAGIQTHNSTTVGISNSGSITGGNGMRFGGTGTKVENSGEIMGNNAAGSGSGFGIQVTGSDFILKNSGLISGSERAFDGGANREVIYNSGTMQGDVVLNGGDDVYRGSGDAVVLGGVRGSAGDDDITGARASDYLDGGNGNDKVKGNEGADTLVGGNGRDLLFGGNDDDEIEGGNAGDLMLGGGGSDEFLFTDTNDIGTTGATRDEIRDFEQGVDIINLSAMIGPDFVFRGTSGFTGSGPAELRLAEGGGSTYVQLDYDGDGSQDGRMLIRGVTGMTEDDFIL